MKPHLERRQPDRDPADTLSPECLALLVSCGDEIRATDEIVRPPVVNTGRRGRRRDDRDHDLMATGSHHAHSRATDRPAND